jgi:hypothetical protein
MKPGDMVRLKERSKHVPNRGELMLVLSERKKEGRYYCRMVYVFNDTSALFRGSKIRSQRLDLDDDWIQKHYEAVS